MWFKHVIKISCEIKFKQLFNLVLKKDTYVYITDETRAICLKI